MVKIEILWGDLSEKKQQEIIKALKDERRDTNKIANVSKKKEEELTKALKNGEPFEKYIRTSTNVIYLPKDLTL